MRPSFPPIRSWSFGSSKTGLWPGIVAGGPGKEPGHGCFGAVVGGYLTPGFGTVICGGRVSEVVRACSVVGGRRGVIDGGVLAGVVVLAGTVVVVTLMDAVVE